MRCTPNAAMHGVFALKYNSYPLSFIFTIDSKCWKVFSVDVPHWVPGLWEEFYLCEIQDDECADFIHCKWIRSYLLNKCGNVMFCKWKLYTLNFSLPCVCVFFPFLLLWYMVAFLRFLFFLFLFLSFFPKDVSFPQFICCTYFSSVNILSIKWHSWIFEFARYCIFSPAPFPCFTLQINNKDFFLCWLGCFTCVHQKLHEMLIYRIGFFLC